MIKVRNRSFINTLSYRSLKSGKKRNIMAIIAIALTTLLFTGLLTIGISMMDYVQQQTMRQVGTTAHGGFKFLSQEQYEKVLGDPKLEDVSANIFVGTAKNPQLKKQMTEVRWFEDDAARWSFCYPEEGRMPKEYKEIACGTAVLDALGIPHEIGSKIDLSFEVNGKLHQDTFTLCGFWETDPVVVANEILLSEEYVKDVTPAPTVPITEQENPSHIAGYWNPYFFFSGQWDIEGQVEALMDRCGFDSTVDSGVNWAYQSSSVDLDTYIIVGGILLLIIFAGYLIIYNIFAISVSRDIHFYGLLKTVGTTGRQIKRIVYHQVFLLAAVGIPIGLAAGWLSGKFLMPVIMSATSYANAVQKMEVSLDPMIFVGGILLSFFTLWLSCLRPCRMAAKVSPVDAVRWNEPSLTLKRKEKRKARTVTPFAMAIANLRRTPGKTIIVVLSLTLSLTLLNTVTTIVQGYDQDKYIDQIIVTDYILVDASVSTLSSSANLEGISYEIMDEVKAQPGLKDAGAVYYDSLFMNVDKNNGEVRNKIEGQAKYLEESVGAVYIEEDLRRLEEENKYLTGISGIDDFILGKLKIYAGEIDPEKFRTGNYIIVGPSLNGDTDEDTAASAYYKIGDKVRVDWEDGTSKEYEVMAIGDLPNSIGPRSRFLMETDLIIPSTEYLQHRTPDGALSFALDCTDDEAGAKLGIWLEDYCENSVSTVFESRGTYMENFESMTNVVSNVGSALAFILALISILNFINSMVTSIFIRQRELAMLQSVGMTRRQMRRMLLGEGFGHILLGILLSALISSLVGYGLGMTLEGMVSFYSYRFVIWPILACTPILLLFAAAVPMIAFRMMCRSTVVERLRQID